MGSKLSSITGQSGASERKVPKKSSSTSTREMVIRLEEKMDMLMEEFKTHKVHHWAVELALLTAGIGLLISILI